MPQAPTHGGGQRPQPPANTHSLDDTEKMQVPQWILNMRQAFKEPPEAPEASSPLDDEFEAFEGTTYVDSSVGAVPPGAADDSSDELETIGTKEPPPLALICMLIPDPIILNRDEVTSIGRSPKATISLHSSKVSRLHAEIRYDGQGFSIHDLNSTNGTFVNGNRVYRRRRLRADMKIECGPFSFKVLDLNQSDVDEAVWNEVDGGDTETRFDLDAAFTGMLEETGVAEIIQFIEAAGKTGELMFYHRKGQGRVWIEEGNVIHAEYGAEYGLNAALQLFSMTRGRFEFRNATVQCPRTVNKSTTHLLMEAARLADEASLENTDIA